MIIIFYKITQEIIFDIVKSKFNLNLVLFFKFLV